MILAVIPARGGSKGIPKKNIRSIAGKPLIAWTIEAAKASRLINRCVVSTEDRRIAGIARACGAEVLTRPKSLSGDRTPTLSVLQHALARLPADIVVLLQPTSPVRSHGLIDSCIRKFIRGGYDSLATGFICRYLPYGKNTLPRQLIPGFFYDDGNVYVIKANLIKKGDRYGKRIGKMLTTRAENVEIDEPFDFWLAEQLLKKGGRV